MPLVRRVEGVEAIVAAQRDGCAAGGSPLYSRVLDAVLEDYRAGGSLRSILDARRDDTYASAPALRVLAGVHRLVLAGELPRLARHYPSAGGSPGRDLETDFVAACAERGAEITELAGVGLQTNEVGRSAALLGGFLELAAVGLPLRVLEVGASAGLNLRWDRYRYEAGADSFGPTDSPVRFVDPWRGRPPPLATPVEVVERHGCDLNPVDPTAPEGRLALRAWLWPDQVERRARLDAAIAVASEVPAPVDRADAALWLAGRLDEPVPGITTVVVHTIVSQYLSAETRRALTEVIESTGARAEAVAPVAWLRMEPGGSDRAHVTLTCWPDTCWPGSADPRVVARSGFHGPPIDWRG